MDIKFKLNIANSTKRTSSSFVKQSKICYGTVIEVDGIYKVSIDSDKNGTEEIILDFTPESFELKGRKEVFTIVKDKFGKLTRIIRDDSHAKFFPGLPEQYTPFAPNWIVKGYIVRKGIQKFFEFKQLIGLDGYDITKNKYVQTEE